MADDINVKVQATTTSVGTAFAEAGAAVKGFAADTKTEIAGVNDTLMGMQSAFLKITAVLAGGAIFKSVIESTFQWKDAVEQLSKQFGESAEAASGFNAAIKIVGGNSDMAVSAMFKMDRQVRTNEKTLNDLGIATRDTNGNFLDQQTIFMNGLRAVEQYKQGTDANIVSQFVFGRSQSDMITLHKLNNDKLQEGAQLAQQWGLSLDENGIAKTEHYQQSLNKLDLQFQGVKQTIMNELLPGLASTADGFNKDSVGIKVVVDMIKVLETAFIGLEEVANIIMTEIGRELALMVSHFEQAGKVMSDIANLDFTKAGADKREGRQQRADIDSGAHDKNINDANDAQVALKTLWGLIDTAPQAALDAANGTGGTKGAPAGLGKNGGGNKLTEDEQLAKEETAFTLAQNQIQLQSKRDQLQAEVDAGKITEAQKIQQLQDLATQELAFDEKALDDEIASGNLSVLQLQQLNDKKVLLQEKYNADILKMNLELAAAEKKQREQDLSVWKQGFDSIGSAFKGMVTGILQGTQTWQQTLQKFWTNILSSFVETCEKLAMKWLWTELTKTSATTAGETERLAVTAAAQKTGGAMETATSQKEIGQSAATAAAHVYSSVAAIPLIGWLLAPPAAAAAFVAVEAFGSSLPAFADGAWNLPSDMTARVHKGEMILPAPFAQDLRNKGGSSFGSQGNPQFYISAIDGQSVKNMLINNADTIHGVIKNGQRNNALRSMQT